jgi:hypothetical protein
VAAFADLVEGIAGVDEALRIAVVGRSEHLDADVAQRSRECDELLAVLCNRLLGFLGGQVARRAVVFELRAFFHDVTAVHHDQVRALGQDDRLAAHLGPLLVRVRLLLDGLAPSDGRADRLPQEVSRGIDHGRHHILDAGDRLERRCGRWRRRSGLPGLRRDRRLLRRTAREQEAKQPARCDRFQSAADVHTDLLFASGEMVQGPQPASAEDYVLFVR